MNFKTKLTSLNHLTALIMIAACTYSLAYSNNAHAISGEQTREGTRDGGGGSYYRGKILESYINPLGPKELPSYKKYIAPMLEALQNYKPEKGKIVSKQGFRQIYNLLNYIINTKTWYFIPGPVNQLPKNTNGAAVITTEGIAQNFSEIWVSLDYLNDSTQSEKDKALSLMHELMMGLKILRLDSERNQCLVIEDRNEICSGTSLERNGELSDLTQLDYQQIRSVGTKIFTDFDKLSGNDIAELLGENDFTNYFNKPSNQRGFTKDEIISAALSAEHIGFNLGHAFLGETFSLPKPNWTELPKKSIKPSEPTVYNSQKLCSFSFTQGANNSLKATLNIDDQSISYEVSFTTGMIKQSGSETRELVEWNDQAEFTHFRELGSVYQVSLPNISEDLWKNIGNKRRSINLWLDVNDDNLVKAVKYDEIVCTNKNCTHLTNIPAKQILCTLSPTLTRE